MPHLHLSFANAVPEKLTDAGNPIDAVRTSLHPTCSSLPANRNGL